ncbi:zinc metalloprotease [Spongiactinospora sp. TRM90649]|uniref:zinc metalloprotease n=1 Tax=Spongiactinospora sp. TRM90649 TaxID=3031114 RepID=UPI0023F7BB9B|nr:zinc metalloprotease [Spongiactinospora sp. TRM90649]MDF5752590.1 zinc metalloprotease [Spongiactinospora sp. TRM90649]
MARRSIAAMAVCLFALGTAAPAAGGLTASGAPPDAGVPGVPSPGSVALRGVPAAAARVAEGCPPAAGHGHGAHSVGLRGAEPGAPDSMEVRRMMADLELRTRLMRIVPPPVINVPLWVHLIDDGSRRVTKQAVQAQVDALNNAYGGRLGGADTRVRFRVAGMTNTGNATWFRDPLGHEQAMKQALRRGGATALNLYIAELNEVVLGYGTYPYWYRTSPVLDGVVIDWRSMPGGTMRTFDRGFTAVHEIGHWLGLMHTFENGCAEPGDGVADTPPEAHPTEGCPEGKDTCPLPGKDPVRNFMDYAHDRCMSEFTAGQGARIRTAWAAYRMSDGRSTLNR